VVPSKDGGFYRGIYIKEERMYIDEAFGGDDNDIESLSSDTTGCSGFPTETDKHYHSIEEKNYIYRR
jgi:hypothetical protein